MNQIILPMLGATTCTKESTAGAVFGVVILLAVLGTIIFFAVANAQARRKLAAATAELSYLRPENARLQQWLGGMSGGLVGQPATSQEPVTSQPEYGGYGVGTAIPPQWYSDPSGRHQLRYWNGTAWADVVSDHGVTSTDPAR